MLKYGKRSAQAHACFPHSNISTTITDTVYFTDPYFPPERDTILPAIVRALRLEKEPEYFPLTLGQLEESIKKGRLV